MLPSGFRDLEPRLARVYEHVVDTLRNVFRKYGFEPLYTPHLEYWDVLKGKYGEEAESLLIWRFEDIWSGEWYALRYDHTVPLARHVASKKYTLPFKRYTIGNVFRHERPQRGRFREFLQADIDIVGSPYPEADAEILNVVVESMESLGFRDYIVKISDRRILSGVLRYDFGVKDEIPIFRIIDKLDKIGLEGVKKELLERMDRKAVKKLVDIINIKKPIDGALAELNDRFENPISQEGIHHLEEIEPFLSPLAKRRVILSLELARGLDYYTGPIWEVIVENAGVGSVGGGGRYDNLIGIYSKEQIPATGSSFGVDRIVEVGLQKEVFRINVSSTKVFVVAIDREVFREAWSFAQTLRNAGIPTEVDLMRRKLSKQREYAKKKDIPILVFIGKKEVKEKKVTIYTQGIRLEIDLKDALDKVKELIEKL